MHRKHSFTGSFMRAIRSRDEVLQSSFRQGITWLKAQRNWSPHSPESANFAEGPLTCSELPLSGPGLFLSPS